MLLALLLYITKIPLGWHGAFWTSSLPTSSATRAWKQSMADLSHPIQVYGCLHPGTAGFQHSAHPNLLSSHRHLHRTASLTQCKAHFNNLLRVRIFQIHPSLPIQFWHALNSLSRPLRHAAVLYQHRAAHALVLMGKKYTSQSIFILHSNILEIKISKAKHFWRIKYIKVSNTKYPFDETAACQICHTLKVRCCFKKEPLQKWFNAPPGTQTAQSPLSNPTGCNWLHFIHHSAHVKSI